MIDSFKYLGKQMYKVLSKKGRNLGTYKTEEDAEKRLKMVEMFKKLKEKNSKKSK